MLGYVFLRAIAYQAVLMIYHFISKLNVMSPKDFSNLSFHNLAQQ